MRKFIALLTIISVVCLVACAPKTGGKDKVTPTPNNKDNTQATAVPSAGPGDPDFSIDLEEDVLEGGEATPEATGTANTDSTNTLAPTNTQSPTVTNSAGAVATATPTPTEVPIISLPFDSFV